MSNRVKFFLPILLLIGVISALAFTAPPLSYASPSSVLSTSTPIPSMDQTTPGGPPLSLTISLLCFCLTFLLIIGVFVLGVVVRRKGSSDDKL
ncbi:MAG: hypothetical protein HZB18_01425 [Chloroflexi bacterium]|nr:hypothetical protein [Chloroflexota bacterium]